MATIRRNPMSTSTNSLNEQYMNFLEYKGLNTNKNYVSIDQETFTEVNNMYVNQENQLSTRPPIEIFVASGGNTNVIKIWKVNDKTFYHVVQKDDIGNIYVSFMYPTDAGGLLSITLTKNEIAADSIHFCWFNYAYALFTKNKLYCISYDNTGAAAVTESSNDAVYFPITKLHNGANIYTVDNPDPTNSVILQNPNVLTTGYRERYLFNNDITTPTGDIENKTVTIRIDNDTYTIKWQPYIEKVFYKSYGTIVRTNTYDYKVVSNEEGTLSLYLVTAMFTSKTSPFFSTIHYISSDANTWYTFNTPKYVNATLPVISDDLGYIYCARIEYWEGHAYYKKIDLTNLYLLSTTDWTEITFDCYINGALPNYMNSEHAWIKLTLDDVRCAYQTGSTSFSNGVSNKGTAYLYLNSTVSVSALNTEDIPLGWYNGLPMYVIVIGNITDGFTGTIFFTTRPGPIPGPTSDYPTYLNPADNIRNFVAGLFYKTNYRISFSTVQVGYDSTNINGLARITNYLMYANSNKIIRTTPHKSDQFTIKIITMNPQINDAEPDTFDALALVTDIGTVSFKDTKYVYIRYNKAINENEFIDVFSSSDKDSTAAEYTIRTNRIREWTDSSQLITQNDTIVTLPVQPVQNNFTVLDCLVSSTKDILTSNSLYYSNTVVQLLKPVDNPIYIGYKGNTFVWEAIIYENNIAQFYTNQYTNIIEVDYTNVGEVKYILPQHSVDFITTCLSQDNVFYQSSKSLYDVDKTAGKNLFYIPEVKDKQNVLTDKITALVNFSQTALGIFLETTAYQFTYDSTNDNYYLSKTKLSLGNRDGADMLLSYDGNNIYITTLKGLSTLNYQDFVQSTEQIYKYLTEAIMDTYRRFAKEPIKLCQYKDYLLLYHTDSTEILVFDLRTASWWKWTLPIKPMQIVYNNDNRIISEFYEYQGGLTVISDKSALYVFNFEKESVYDGTELVPFDWSFTTQKMHFGAPNNYKHIRSVSIVTEQSGRPLRFKLKFTNYRNLNNLSDSDTVEYDIDQLTTMIKRVNFIKTNAFQLQVSNDKTDKYAQAFVTPNIAIKYRITERLR